MAWEVRRVGRRRARAGERGPSVVVELAADAPGAYLQAGDRLRLSPREHPRDCPLTPRELETLRLLADGRSYKEIALAGHFAESTVRTHLHQAYIKLGVRDRALAVLKAVEENWL